ncbi:hypothetical protein V2E25_00510 [Mycoplasmopsis arginini]|uniref:Uncharacterized protein n=1 Tax=Mycoplasmopsis arginini TaxID=2094 RepID=A0ABZ2AM22_MYCAR|nr:hypothetical protein [Mycoplasmopsis arginini]WVN22073.1 hypothetical protein V2E25_00510 [Mycoplasmopsis arginini]
MISSVSVLVANSYSFFVGFCYEIRALAAEISSSRVAIILLYFAKSVFNCDNSSSASLTFCL